MDEAVKLRGPEGKTLPVYTEKGTEEKRNGRFCILCSGVIEDELTDHADGRRKKRRLRMARVHENGIRQCFQRWKDKHFSPEKKVKRYCLQIVF
ncbi:MAG: hypothetical protein J5841_04510 [Clostridia bacterium]|nr:hypothetical protein [Clostridia bacterium]